MNNRLVVCRLDPVDELPDERKRFIERERTSERLALDNLHDEIVRADVVEMTDVGVVQRRDGPGFALETLTELLGGHLDCDIAPKARIVGSVDGAHAAAADVRRDLVGSEPGSDRKGQGVLRDGRWKMEGWKLKI